MKPNFTPIVDMKEGARGAPIKQDEWIRAYKLDRIGRDDLPSSSTISVWYSKKKHPDIIRKVGDALYFNLDEWARKKDKPTLRPNTRGVPRNRSESMDEIPPEPEVVPEPEEDLTPGPIPKALPEALLETEPISKPEVEVITNINEDDVNPFNHEIFGRLTILSINGEPWFVGREVATILGYADPSSAVSKKCKHLRLLKVAEMATLKVPARGLSIIPERDLYCLVMESKLPDVAPFKEWVYGTVLPSIRKTGSYSMDQAPEPEPAMATASVSLVDVATELKGGMDLVKTMGLMGNSLTPCLVCD